MPALSAAGGHALADAALRPVAGRGRMTPEGYRPENYEWLDVLAPRDADGRRVGRDPGEVDLRALAASGHPRCIHGARNVVSRMNEYGARDEHVGETRLTGLRERYCYPCRPSEGFSDGPNHPAIRRCDIIDCPCWQFRLGFNPHNPRRGKNPFLMGGADARTA